MARIYTDAQVKAGQEAAAARRLNMPKDTNVSPVVSLSPTDAAKTGATDVQDVVTTPQVKVPTTSTVTPTTTGVQVDPAKEAQTVSTLGFKPTTKEEQAKAILMTYGENVPDQYKALLDEVNAAKDQGALDTAAGKISAFGQSAQDLQTLGQNEVAASQPRLDVLQEALRMKSTVGNQPIGTSETFKQSGVPELGGYGALAASLQARGAEMDYKYNSFSNLVKTIGGQMYAQNQTILNEATNALNSYKQLNDEYKYQQERADTLAAVAQAKADQLELYQAKADIDYKSWKKQYDEELGNRKKTWNSDLGAFVDDGGNIYYPSDATSENPTGGTGSRISGRDNSNRVIVESDNPNAWNCVKYGRESAANLPFGLWHIADKRAIVNSNEGKIGNLVLTTESSPGQDTGHVAKIIGLTANGDYVLEEANYIPGKITTGSILPKDSPVILGYFDPNLSAKMTSYAPGALDNPDMAGYEGVNPEGAEFGVGTSAESDILTEAYSALIDNLSSKGTSKANITNIKNSFDKALKTGDTDAAKQKLLSGAYNNATAKAQGEIDSRDTSLSSLQEISRLLDQYTGPMNVFTGTEEQIANKIGKTTDPNLAALQTTMLIELQKYRQAVTGAAASTAELPEYLKIMPNILSEKDFNKAKIDSLIGALNRNQATVYKNNMGISLDNFYTLYPEYSQNISSTKSSISDAASDYVNQLLGK